MSSATPRVVVIGDALIDELRADGEVTDHVGGAALNVAVGLARLGHRAQLVCMLGDDADGERIRAYLDDHGVEVVASPSERGTARAISERIDGEPTYAFNDAARFRDIRFDAAQRAAIADAEVVIVSCFRFDDDAQFARMRDAIDAGTSRLVVDANPRAGMLHAAEAFIRNLESLLPRTELLKLGDDDAHLLWNDDLDAVVSGIRSRSDVTVMVTRGADGAGIRGAGDDVDVPIAHSGVPIIDTMGAGDSVVAATVHRLLAGEESWPSILAFAMRVAEATCAHEGALLQTPDSDV